MTISAKVITHSIANNTKIITFEAEYPKFIHSEFMTHRTFSRNASSSRAIPVQKMIDQVQKNPAMPIHWGKNQSGMQAKAECNEKIFMDYKDDSGSNHWMASRESAWNEARNVAIDISESFSKAGYHKQIVNRLTEPFQHIKVIVTATEWDNFFKLRLHPDAQPEMYELARVMKEAMDSSTPVELLPGEWHLPYVTTTRKEYDNSQEFWSMGDDTAGLSEEEAIKCSVARCAKLSYNNHDNSNPNIEKDLALADKLLKAGHMSPFEHQATPMEYTGASKSLYGRHWQEGITHMDRSGEFWSGNFRGWIQYRQLIN